MRRVWLALALASLFTLRAAAQSAPAPVASGQVPAAPANNGALQITLGHSALALMGPWKFRIGDDPAWAQPGFDDAGWQDYTLDVEGLSDSLLSSENGLDPGWAGHGHRGESGYGWYRIHLHLNRPSDSIALVVPCIDSAEDVYWDGQKIGAYGDPSRRWAYFICRTQVLSIPSTLARSGDHVLALRVWDMPLVQFERPAANGGLRAAPLVAHTATAQRIKQLVLRLGQLRNTVNAATGVVPYLLVGLISLVLFFYNRKRLEYLWAALTLLAFSFSGLLIVLDGFSSTGWLTQSGYFVADLLSGSVFLFGLLTLQWLLELQDRRALLATNLIVGALPFLAYAAFILNGEWIASANLSAFLYSVVEVSLLPCLACLLWMAVAGIRKLGRQAWLMLSPGLVLSVLFIWLVLTNGPSHSRFSQIFSDILVMLVPASVLAILVYRFVRQWREHQRIEGELQQAQAVQALLVPEQFPHSPHYRVEGTYLPASQVGGDFYQVLPLPDGGLIVVLGDVSGKGLRAAMVVSMAVGAVRAIARQTSQPDEILTRLNQELTGNLNSGFVTCVCARFDADGTVTVANAGHLPPWVNGKELSMPGALPLGMLPDLQYEAQTFQMDDGEVIIVMSDGVVEARSEKDGQLFGFDRLAALLIARPSAQQVAHQAMQFGQEDDISVLSVTRTPSRKAVLA